MPTNQLLELLKNLPFRNLDLLSVGIIIAAIGILGFVIYLGDRKSITNKSFLYLAISASLWSTLNYLSYQSSSVDITLLILRLLMFSAVWFAFSLFQLLYVFPKKEVKFPLWYRFILIPSVIFVLLLTLTIFVFNYIVGEVMAGQVASVAKGPGIIPFAILVFFLVGGGIYRFVKRAIVADKKERGQLRIVLKGIIITFTLIIALNFILPAFFSNYFFIPFGAFFIFPFVAFTGYAIYKHQLFNLRSAAMAGLTVALSVVSFSEIIFAQDISAVIYRSSVFMIVLIISFLMNKFVQTIAEQREQLQAVNEQQTNLLNFITHQVKGFFTKSKYIFSALIEGEYGRLEDKMETVVKEGLRSDNDGIDMVQNVLSAANIKRGTMAYNMSPIDLKSLILDLVSEQRKNAEAKNLFLEIDIKDGNYSFSGDYSQLKHVVKNLIDNSIKYTPAGKITVSLSKNDGKILFSVKDTGVGLTKEDKEKLFTEG
ncbi:MAG: Histidine kinase-, gyrase, partial [Parcubacteria group bacterium]|nr:Histidine kinase-, gyrase [Parcubacteria group bacterium]